MNSKIDLVIPSEFKVGFNKRSDTFSGMLGYMIYANKPNGVYGSQKSFDNWIDQSIKVEVVQNIFQLGFVIHKGFLNTHFMGANAKYRIHHPSGFEFEITQDNLNIIIAYCDLSKGEILTPCVIAWNKQKVFLLPENFKEVDINVEVKSVTLNHIEQEKINEKRKIEDNNYLKVNTLNNNEIYEDEFGNKYMLGIPVLKNKTNQNVGLSFVEKFDDKFIYKQSIKNTNRGIEIDKLNMKKFIYPLSEGVDSVSKSLMKKFTKRVFFDNLNSNEKEAWRNLQNLVSVSALVPQNLEFEPLILEKDYLMNFFENEVSDVKNVVTNKVIKYGNNFLVLTLNTNEIMRKVYLSNLNTSSKLYEERFESNTQWDFKTAIFLNIGNTLNQYNNPMSKGLILNIDIMNGKVVKDTLNIGVENLLEKATPITKEDLALFKPVRYS